MSRFYVLLGCLMAAPVFPSGGAWAQSGDLSPAFVLAGFRDSRERLRTGLYRARGVKVEDQRPLANRRLEGPVELFVAFDYEADKVRFDRTEVVWPFLAGDDPARAPNGMPLLTGKWVKTPERSVVWRNIKTKHSQSTVIVYPASVKPPREVDPFDIRIVGISNIMGYLHNTQMPRIVDNYTKWAADGKVSRVDGTTVRLEWRDDSTLMSIDFDEKNGYLPTRYEERWIRPPPGIRRTRPRHRPSAGPG